MTVAAEADLIGRPSLRRTAETDPAAPTVVILCPGGLEHGGGIGRQMSYFLAAPGELATSPAYRLLDTRGPWFLGDAHRRLGASLGYFVRCGGSLLALRAGRANCLLHVNITGRGSTVRKAILCSIASALNLRFLLHVHDPDYLSAYARLPRPLRAIVRAVFRKAETVIVLGARDRERLIDGLGLPKGRVQVLYNAVPDPAPRGAPARDQAQPCQILFLGHLSQRKGVPELLRALATPAMRERPWQAVLAGGGPRETYRDMAETLGIGSRITFPGWLGQTTSRNSTPRQTF